MLVIKKREHSFEQLRRVNIAFFWEWLWFAAEEVEVGQNFGDDVNDHLGS